MTPPATPGTVELTWLGQSGFLLRFPSANVLVDPFLSDRGERLVQAPALESLGSIDIVAATHEHWDHLDLARLREIGLDAPLRVDIPADHDSVGRLLLTDRSCQRAIRRRRSAGHTCGLHPPPPEDT